MSVRADTSRAVGIRTHILDGFDDPRFGRKDWNRLLARGQTDVVFLTWEFQRAWWDTFEPGELLLIAAERDGDIVALAPFHHDEWSIEFVGSGNGDWLDLIGDTSDDRVVHALIAAAHDHAPTANFCLTLMPGRTGRLAQLESAAEASGLTTWQLTDELMPALDIAAFPDAAAAAAAKKSLVRHERFFRRNGELVVEHLHDGHAILPHLDEFFEQHVARWAVTEDPSEFAEDGCRDFVRHLTELAGETGWLRFTRVVWNDIPIAFHFGLCYAGRFHWWRPSFSIDLARRSPGEVLLRSLLLAAIEEGVRVFDFGLGVLPFKLRFATRIDSVDYWGTER